MKRLAPSGPSSCFELVTVEPSLAMGDSAEYECGIEARLDNEARDKWSGAISLLAALVLPRIWLDNKGNLLPLSRIGLAEYAAMSGVMYAWGIVSDISCCCWALIRFR